MPEAQRMRKPFKIEGAAEADGYGYGEKSSASHWKFLHLIRSFKASESTASGFGRLRSNRLLFQIR